MADWFEKLFGFRESGYANVQRKLEVSSAPDGSSMRMRSVENGKSYNIGDFSTPTLGELRLMGGNVALPGKLRVTNVEGDVEAMHADPANRLAVFQVASQFNCLEFVGPTVTPEDGITGYIHDRTQGPICSIACGPATAYRNYFAAMEGRKGSAPQRGQTSKRQIENLAGVSELLGNTGQFFEVKGGYTLANAMQLGSLNKTIQCNFGTEAARDLLRAALRVGVHRDVEVTATGRGARMLDKPNHLVTQVFGSACSVTYSGNPVEQWEAFGSMVLEASYEATLWAAVLNAAKHGGKDGSRVVYLTMLGGGVFGNSMSWISGSMSRAFAIFREYDLEIRIVTYRGPVDEEFLNLER